MTLCDSYTLNSTPNLFLLSVFVLAHSTRRPIPARRSRNKPRTPSMTRPFLHTPWPHFN
ncbi:hypothetical protein BDV93DRAFT_517619 [Ceratobasidium sp. AG-I]|nr:hypothetical protein BDV93DRAFT_517619 [Ceratobasidium sp. AG-I]